MGHRRPMQLRWSSVTSPLSAISGSIVIAVCRSLDAEKYVWRRHDKGCVDSTLCHAGVARIFFSVSRTGEYRQTHTHIHTRKASPTVAVAMISPQSTDQCEAETSHLGVLAYSAVELDDAHRTAT